MTVTRFREIKLSTKRTFKCTVCGKRGQKSYTAYRTVNPFNRNEDGTVKSPQQILAEVQAEVRGWEPEPIHDKCVAEEV
jgi:hypothetical protein